MRRLALGSVFAFFVVTGACATGGVGLSSRDLTASDLAGMEYTTMYELLRVHTRVRVTTPTGADGLFVGIRGERELTSGDIEGNPGRPVEGITEPPTGEEGVPQEPPEKETITAGSSRYRAAVLYVDGSEEPDPISWLRATSPDEVERLRVLRPSEASSRFGRSGRMGAIAVTMKKD